MADARMPHGQWAVGGGCAMPSAPSHCSGSVEGSRAVEGACMLKRKCMRPSPSTTFPTAETPRSDQGRGEAFERIPEKPPES